MTGRDDKLPSVLVLAQDGRTAPLRTLNTRYQSVNPSPFTPSLFMCSARCPDPPETGKVFLHDNPSALPGMGVGIKICVLVLLLFVPSLSLLEKLE